MVESLIKVLEAGLSLWASKEKRKYLDKIIKLKRAFYEEYNKSDEDRSDSIMDNISNELCLLSKSFASEVGAENLKDS